MLYSEQDDSVFEAAFLVESIPTHYGETTFNFESEKISVQTELNALAKKHT